VTADARLPGPAAGPAAGPVSTDEPALGSPAGGVSTDEPVLDLRVVPYDDPVVQALVAELMDDLDERYADAAEGTSGDNPEVVGEWRVRSEQVTPPNGVMVIARLGGAPVGCGAIRRLLRGPTDVAEIKRMYTAPSARRRGVSRALLGRLEAEATRLGYRRLQLETGQRQPEAIALYESAGYVPIPNYGQYADDELSLCYAKDLPPGDSGGSGDPGDSASVSSTPGGPTRTYHSQP
jgi:GNAT superfamily N-acetyltransferase